MKADVFICYSRADQQRVMSLVERLRGMGVSAWIDYKGIAGASLYRQEIVEAIESCKVLILMVSKSAVESNNVVREVTIAEDKKKPILPLFLESVVFPTSIRYQLAGIQGIELFHGDEEKQFEEIARSLSEKDVRMNASAASSDASDPVTGSETLRDEGSGGPEPVPDQPTSTDPSTAPAASRLGIAIGQLRGLLPARGCSVIVVLAALSVAVALPTILRSIRKSGVTMPGAPPGVPVPALGRARPNRPVSSRFKFSTPTLYSTGKLKKRNERTADSYTEDLGSGVKLQMVKIPPGVFIMGSSDADVRRAYQELKRYTDGAELKHFVRETPQHIVLIKYAFYMGRFEVTQAQWRAIMGNNPAAFEPCDECPVQQVSWNDAVDFCARLSEQTGDVYRLPTEAEWEYAARAGTTTPFAFGDTLSPEIANYNGAFPYAGAPTGIYREKSVRVGSLGVANAFGLSDVHGNVREWCEDWYHDSYKTIAGDAPNDGSAWLTGGEQKNRVLRGGSWYSRAVDARSADRHWPDQPNIRNPTFGLRVVVTAGKST